MAGVVLASPRHRESTRNRVPACYNGPDMSDNGQELDDGESRALTPVDGKRLPGHFPDWVKERALVLCELTGSATRAQHQLQEELQGSGIPTPAYPTIWGWARDRETVIAAMKGDRKSELVAMASDVMEVYAGQAIDAADKLNPYQKVIAYGVSADKRVAWERGAGGAVQAFQINLYPPPKGDNA